MERIEIEPLRLARVELPDFHPEAPGSCEIFGFLIRDGAARILVDTGVGEASPLIERLYKPRRSDLGAVLSSVGDSLERITAIVNSHLHFDHCGNNRLFPGIPIFVQEAELEAARQPNYTVREWVDFPGADYARVRGEQRISPHVVLLPSPGHAPGHQSVVVDSPGGVQLIVAQAAYTASEFEASRTGRSNVPEGTWSARSYAASRSALHGIGARRAFFSHDSTIWAAAP
jgi:glyoxylase-like metal-dependent hydrolase (beta-lactamase superfamily II)